MITTPVRFATCVLLTLVGCAEGMQDGRPLRGQQVQTTAPKRRVETGQVNWLRDFDEAKALAARTDKPMLLLFQEIPG